MSCGALRRQTPRGMLGPAVAVRDVCRRRTSRRSPIPLSHKKSRDMYVLGKTRIASRLTRTGDAAAAPIDSAMAHEQPDAAAPVDSDTAHAQPDAALDFLLPHLSEAQHGGLPLTIVSRQRWNGWCDCQSCTICKRDDLVQSNWEIVLEWGDSKCYESLPDVCDACGRRIAALCTNVDPASWDEPRLRPRTSP